MCQTCMIGVTQPSKWGQNTTHQPKFKKKNKDEADVGPTPSLATENLPFSSGDSDFLIDGSGLRCDAMVSRGG